MIECRVSQARIKSFFIHIRAAWTRWAGGVKREGVRRLKTFKGVAGRMARACGRDFDSWREFVIARRKLDRWRNKMRLNVLRCCMDVMVGDKHEISEAMANVAKVRTTLRTTPSSSLSVCPQLFAYLNCLPISTNMATNVRRCS